jgi:ribosomal protein S27E
MKFVLVKCKHCNYPQFVNINFKTFDCLVCGKEFEIIDGKEKEYYDKGISYTGKNS